MNDYRKERSTWWNCICYHIEHVQMIADNPDIKCCSYILHDKDVDSEGKIKKPHWHIVIQFFTNQRGSWFNRLDRDDLGQVNVQATNSPQAAYEYLTHKNHPKKYQYPDSAITGTITNFDPVQKEEDPNQALYTDMHSVASGKMSWQQLFKRAPKRIHMASHIKTVVELFKSEKLEEFVAFGELPEKEKEKTEQLTVVTDEKLKQMF